MPRTEEQKAADRQLTEAVEAVRKAYDFAPGSVVTDYVLLVDAVSFDAEGDGVTHFMSHPRDGNSVSISSVLGMLRKGTLYTERWVLDDD